MTKPNILKSKIVFIYAADYIEQCKLKYNLNTMFTNRYQAYVLADDLDYFSPQNTTETSKTRMYASILERMELILQRDNLTKIDFKDNRLVPSSNKVSKSKCVYNNDVILNFALSLKLKGKIPVIVTQNPYTILNALYLNIAVNPDNEQTFEYLKKGRDQTFFWGKKTRLFFPSSYITKCPSNFYHYMENPSYIKVIFSCVLEELIHSGYIDIFHYIAYMISTCKEVHFFVTPSVKNTFYSSDQNIVFTHAISIANTLKSDSYLITEENDIPISPNHK